MKKFIIIIIAFIIVLLPGCVKEDTISENVVFNGTIEEINDNSILGTTADELGFDKADPNQKILTNVNHSNAESPDRKYQVESYGINIGVTSGGLYPAEGIHIIDLAANQVLWQMDGYYDTKFLWSDDSRYLAVTYTAAIYANTVVIDTMDFSEIVIPVPEEILEQMREYRPDPYFEAAKWIDADNILISFQYTGRDEQAYSGTYSYQLSSCEINEVIINTVSAG